MIDQKFLNDIKNQRNKKKSKEDIYLAALQKGYKVDFIHVHYALAEKGEMPQDTHQKKTIQIVVTIGALLVGAGIFSFVASNWQEIRPPFKVTIIIASMLITSIAGLIIMEKTALRKTGGALIFLGCIIYGSGIFLVAQIFNIRAAWPDGFLLWMIGTLAMAFALELMPLIFLATILGLVVTIGHPFAIFNSFAADPFLLTSSLLLFVATIVTGLTAFILRESVKNSTS